MEGLALLADLAVGAGADGWTRAQETWVAYRAEVRLRWLADLLALLWALAWLWCARTIRPPSLPRVRTTRADRALDRISSGMTLLTRIGLGVVLAMLVGEIHAVAVERGTWTDTPFDPALAGTWGVFFALLVLAPVLGGVLRRTGSPPEGGLPGRGRRRMLGLLASSFTALIFALPWIVAGNHHQAAAASLMALAAS